MQSLMLICNYYNDNSWFERFYYDNSWIGIAMIKIDLKDIIMILVAM